MIVVVVVVVIPVLRWLCRYYGGYCRIKFDTGLHGVRELAQIRLQVPGVILTTFAPEYET
jgi:hypothetical protein